MEPITRIRFRKARVSPTVRGRGAVRGSGVGELVGVLAAVLSSAIGGTAVGATRYVVGATDPLTLGALRFGIGFAFLLPVAVLQGHRMPARADWPGAVGLGILFFSIFPILFNASLAHTTAARGALALSTLPLLTMLVAALLRVESLTARKSAGVTLAMAGVAAALLSGLSSAPEGAWRGDLLMIGAALCMALYNVWSRPFIRRSGPMPFTTFAMAAGAACLLAVSWIGGGLTAVTAFSPAQWLAVLYLGVLGSAFVFFLWGFALSRTTPTRVAISVTVNPVTASILGSVLLGEPIRWNVALGLLAVAVGIWMTTRGGLGNGAADGAAQPVSLPPAWTPSGDVPGSCLAIGTDCLPTGPRHTEFPEDDGADRRD